MQDLFDVIIVGGGIAGLSASKHLSSKLKVLLLEADNSIGGRTKTSNLDLPSGQFAFDIGASWIHGSCQQHPITQLAKKVPGVKITQTKDDSSTVVDEEGNQIGDQIDKAWENYQQIRERFAEAKLHTSVQEYIADTDPSYLKSRQFMFHVANDVEFQSSSSISNLDAQQYYKDDAFQGQEMIMLNGYQRITQSLKGAKTQIQTGKEVKEIKREGGSSIVKCGDGSVYNAKVVLIGVPLGVLKAQKISFQPQLPDWKQQAINGLQFGNVCKILLSFNKPVTTAKQHYIGVAANDVSKRGLCTYFLNLYGLAGLPLLMTFGLGGNADEAQSMSQAELKELIVERVNAFAEEKITVNDFQLYRTSWRSNPLFEGTYTYAGIQTEVNHWTDIGKEVNGWFFCGEHTYPKYRGTVHGAYLSGQQAAKAIQNHLNGGNEKESSSESQDD